MLMVDSPPMSSIWMYRLLRSPAHNPATSRLQGKKLGALKFVFWLVVQIINTLTTRLVTSRSLCLMQRIFPANSGSWRDSIRPKLYSSMKLMVFWHSDLSSQLFKNGSANNVWAEIYAALVDCSRVVIDYVWANWHLIEHRFDCIMGGKEKTLHRRSGKGAELAPQMDGVEKFKLESPPKGEQICSPA